MRDAPSELHHRLRLLLSYSPYVQHDQLAQVVNTPTFVQCFLQFSDLERFVVFVSLYAHDPPERSNVDFAVTVSDEGVRSAGEQNAEAWP